MIAIVTDATCDLPPDTVQQHQIQVVPLYVHFGDSTFCPGVNLTNQQFLDRLQVSPFLPTTKPPSVNDFQSTYERLLHTHTHIVSIHLSQQLGQTYANALAARDALDNPNIYVVDSQTVSGGLGLMALAAARMAAEGHTPEAILKQVETRQLCHRFYLVVDTLEYLHKGGRVGGAKALVGTLFGLRPVLILEKGRIEPVSAVPTWSRAVARLQSLVVNSLAGCTHVHLAIIHVAALNEARRLADELTAAIRPEHLLLCEAGPTVATHTGPGALGVASYYE
jgi:DegV family protein with EDD domain